GTAPPARGRPARPGLLPARPAATAAPTARSPAAPRRSPQPAPAARISWPLPPGPAPGAFGPRRSARRLAHTACTLHTATGPTRQPRGHHQLKIFSAAAGMVLDFTITRDAVRHTAISFG